jgi:hypothetical protein
MARISWGGLISLMLPACDPFGHWPSGERTIEGPLWDRAVVPSADGGIYVSLPQAKALAYAVPGEDAQLIELPHDAEPTRLLASPDASRLLAFSQWPICTADEPVELVKDCPYESLESAYTLNLVSGTDAYATADVPGFMNAIAFAPDDATAVAYLDYETGDDIPVDGVIDLSEVVFIDLEDGDTQKMSVGFSPNNILFSQQNDKAVVLSRSKATVIGLDDFVVDVTYDLTLDADAVVDPVGAQLTPDGRYAIISVQGSSDLYTLDLEIPHVDIKELVAAPSAMWVSPSTDYDFTVLGYTSQTRLDVYDHTYFNDQPVALEEPINRLVGGSGLVVAYNDRASTHDIYRLDLESLDVTEYVAANPVSSLEILDMGGLPTYAVAITRPESSGGSGLDQYQDENWGLAVLDLTTDDIVNLVVEAQPVGMALAERSGHAYALVLLEDVNTLLMVDLMAPSAAQQIELPAAPLGIGEMPDGSFYITHDSPLGLVTFLDPNEPSSLETASGFATLGLFDDDEQLAQEPE